MKLDVCSVSSFPFNQRKVLGGVTMHQVRAVAFERNTTFSNVRANHVRELVAHSTQSRTRDQALVALIECMDPFQQEWAIYGML